jgi:hypothetical protein
MMVKELGVSVGSPLHISNNESVLSNDLCPNLPESALHTTKAFINTACKQVKKSIFCCADVFPSVTEPVPAVTAGKFTQKRHHDKIQVLSPVCGLCKLAISDLRACHINGS